MKDIKVLEDGRIFVGFVPEEKKTVEKVEKPVEKKPTKKKAK